MSLSTTSLLECTDRIQLAGLLGVQLSTLTFYAYGNGKQYKHFEIAKKTGGTRTISAPIGGLNSIQKKLSVLLNDIYKPHPAAHGFIPTESILKNASPHINKRCVLNIDLEDFFPSITATRIIGLLKSDYFKLNNEVASTVVALCTLNDRLPQGAATSPVISNMIAYRLDHQLTALSKKERITYTRYADDITFSSTSSKLPKSLVEDTLDEKVLLGKFLTTIIHDNHFEINQKKVRLQRGTDSKFVTGVKVNQKPNLRRTYVRNLKAMINAWQKHSLENAQLTFDAVYKGNGRDLRNVIHGKLAHLKQIKGKDDLVYRRLHNKVAILESRYDELLPESDIEELLLKIFVVKSGAEYGTGFILDAKWLITCTHVAATDTLKFFPYSKSSLPNTYLETNKKSEWISEKNEYDITALPINEEILTDFNVLHSPSTNIFVDVGTECKVVGFPQYYLGSVPSVIEAKVIKVEKNKYGILDAHVDRTLISGNSGGPVLNQRNQVIGIVRTGAQDPKNPQGFGSTFLPIQEIRKCLIAFESREKN